VDKVPGVSPSRRWYTLEHNNCPSITDTRNDLNDAAPFSPSDKVTTTRPGPWPRRAASGR